MLPLTKREKAQQFNDSLNQGMSTAELRKLALETLGMSEATYYRHRKQSLAGRVAERSTSTRKRRNRSAFAIGDRVRNTRRPELGIGVLLRSWPARYHACQSCLAEVAPESAILMGKRRLSPCHLQSLLEVPNSGVYDVAFDDDSEWPIATCWLIRADDDQSNTTNQPNETTTHD